MLKLNSYLSFAIYLKNGFSFQFSNLLEFFNWLAFSAELYADKANSGPSLDGSLKGVNFGTAAFLLLNEEVISNISIFY